MIGMLENLNLDNLGLLKLSQNASNCMNWNCSSVMGYLELIDSCYEA